MVGIELIKIRMLLMTHRECKSGNWWLLLCKILILMRT